MANETLAKFKTRGITGLLFVIIVLGLISLSRDTAAIFIFLVCVTCAFEYTNITRKGVKDPTFNLSFIMGIGPLIFSFVKPDILEDYEMILLLISVGVMFIFSMSTILFNIRTNHHLLGPLISLFYIGIPMMALSRKLVLGPSTYYHYVLIGLMVFLWSSDTGSYITGRLIGKHPFHKRISPNKTIEGWLGGVPFVLLAAYILSIYFTDFTMNQWMILGVVVWFWGSVGDLYESTIKRQFEIKDSGKGLPGHGGFLDRFDSMLFAGPVFTLIIYFFFNF